MILTGILYSYVYLSAIDRLEVSEAVLMLNCAVLFNGLWGRVLNREVLRRKEIGGVMVVLVGVLMVVTPF
jgi:drug/metabolite transporter (DMT)-like permease